MKITRKLGIFLLTLGIALLVVNSFKSHTKNASVYFVKNEQVMPVSRQISSDKDTLTEVVSELLKGPSVNEQKQGYFTEIPTNTKLIDVQKNHESYTVNLSRKFEEGGGSESMTKRIDQLISTVLDAADKKPVYLQLDGQQVQYIGGEGVEVSQPLSKR